MYRGTPCNEYCTQYTTIFPSLALPYSSVTPSIASASNYHTELVTLLYYVGIYVIVDTWNKPIKNYENHSHYLKEPPTPPIGLTWLIKYICFKQISNILELIN